MAEFATRLSALEAKLTPVDVVENLPENIAAKDESKATLPAKEMSANDEAKTELSGVLNEIKTELSKMVSAPIAPSAPATEQKKAETFAELVNFEMKANNISKGEALRLCIGKYTEQYRKELSAGGFKSF
jgi:hypothetical protein